MNNINLSSFASALRGATPATNSPAVSSGVVVPPFVIAAGVVAILVVTGALAGVCLWRAAGEGDE